MKHVLQRSLVSAVCLLLCAAAPALAEPPASEVMQEPATEQATEPQPEDATEAAPEEATAELAILDSLYDNPDLFRTQRIIVPCLDSGIPCKSDRYCRRNVCGSFGSGCQCNDPSGGDCDPAESCTCQICI